MQPASESHNPHATTGRPARVKTQPLDPAGEGGNSRDTNNFPQHPSPGADPPMPCVGLEPTTR